MLGSVRSPSTVPFTDPMTLISAIAGANGPADDAYLGHVAIVRGSLSQPQLIEVNYNAVQGARPRTSSSVSGDIVYVLFPLSLPDRICHPDREHLRPNLGRQTWAPAVLGSRTSVGVAVPVAPTIH